MNLTKGIGEFFVLFLQNFVNLKLCPFILRETWIQRSRVTQNRIAELLHGGDWDFDDTPLRFLVLLLVQVKGVCRNLTLSLYLPHSYQPVTLRPVRNTLSIWGSQNTDKNKFSPTANPLVIWKSHWLKGSHGTASTTNSSWSGFSDGPPYAHFHWAALGLYHNSMNISSLIWSQTERNFQRSEILITESHQERWGSSFNSVVWFDNLFHTQRVKASSPLSEQKASELR